MLQSRQGFLNLRPSRLPPSNPTLNAARDTGEDAGMTKSMQDFSRDDNAATAVEYALMASLIALSVITGLTNIGTKLSGYFSEVSSAMK